MNVQSRFWDRWLPPFLLGLLLFLAVGVVYSQTLQSPFLFDDETNIVENRFLRIEALNWENLAYVWNAPHPSHRRKLANLSFALNYAWCGLSTDCYHVVNIAIHALSTLLAFGFFYQILGTESLKAPSFRRRLWMAWGAAALWGLHPININAVTYIVQRMTSMSGLFGLLSLNCWLAARKKGGYRLNRHTFLWGGGAVFFWGLGVLSKENLVLLPLMALATEVCLFREGRVRIPGRVWIGFGLLAVLWVLAVDKGRFWEFFNRYEERDFTLAERLLTQLRVLWHYVSLFIFPVGDRFSLIYDFPLSRSLFRPWTTLLSLAGWGVVVGLVAWKMKKWRLFAWATMWFLSGHLLESTILPLEMVYEHRNYFPSLALAFFLIAGGRMLLDKSGVKPLWQLCFLVFFLLVVGSATYARNLDYRTAKAFYQAELRKFPELPRLRLNLAIIHNREGEYREGFSLLRGLVRDYPNDVTILQNWYVFWSIVAKDRARAQTVLARILDLVESGRYSRKLDAPAIRNLALQLKKEGNYRGAIQFLDVLLRDYPKMDSLWVLRGRCFGRLDRWEAARESFERASAFAPQDPAIQFWLGKSHLETGAAQKGCQFLQRAALTPFRQDVAEKSKNLFQERCSGK